MTMYLPLDITIGTDIKLGRDRKFRLCATCGSTVHDRDIYQHDNFHKTFTNRSDGNMSKVMWCDPGDHAFKAESPGSITFQGTQSGEDGRQETVTVDACGEHNPFAGGSVKDAAQLKRLTRKVENEMRYDG